MSDVCVFVISSLFMESFIFTVHMSQVMLTVEILQLVEQKILFI